MKIGKPIRTKFGSKMSLILSNIGEIIYSSKVNINRKLIKKADNTLWSYMGGDFIDNEIRIRITLSLYDKINHYENR